MVRESRFRAVFSLCLFVVCPVAMTSDANPLSTAGGQAVATIPRPPGSDRFSQGIALERTPQAPAVLTDAGDPRLGSHSVADAPRRQISLYPGSDD